LTELTPLDPFDLPDWLGTGSVTWHAQGADRTGVHVRGTLVGECGEEQPCDLVAVDQAYPAPVAGERTRQLVHQLWTNGQVLLVTYDERPALAVPGTGFGADRAVEVLARLARSVGARPEDYVIALRVGVVRGDRGSGG
jgi:hypothetical protein